MRKLIIPIILASILIGGTFALIRVARGQGPAEPAVVNQESQGDNVREISVPDQGNAPQQPDIGFINSPSAVCYQPDPTQNNCYINWYYMSVDAFPSYMITMTVALNAIGIVGNVQGFFQTSMYVPYNMLDRGFKVACGSLGAGGNPNLGNAYSYTIRARDSGGLGSANYGTVYCPAYPHSKGWPMLHKWPVVLAVFLALGLLALFFVAVVSGAQGNLPVVQIGEGPEPPRREANAPDISFIDSQNPTCQLAVPGTGVCYINWGYLYVTATSPQYIISMTVSIDGHIQAYHSGFFQTYMYIPGDFYTPGFRVTCGLSGASGVPGLGNSYSYTIRAHETGGLGAANYGSVTCPADEVRLFLPVTVK